MAFIYVLDHIDNDNSWWCYKINRLSGPTGENNFFRTIGSNKFMNQPSATFILISGRNSQPINTTMNITVFLYIKISNSVYNRKGFVGGCGIVKINIISSFFGAEIWKKFASVCRVKKIHYNVFNFCFIASSVILRARESLILSTTS
mgnify:CR=1 FL=1